MLGNYIATYSIDIAALIFLCYLIYNNNLLNQNRKAPFYFGTALTILIILAEAGTILVGNDSSGLRYLNIICNVFGFALTPVLPIIFIAIFDVNLLKNNKLIVLPSLINLCITVLSPFFGFVFYVDASNHYQRGNLFFVFVAAYIVNVILLLRTTVMTKKGSHDPIRAESIALSFFVVAGTSVQLFVPSVHSSWHSVSLTLLLYYLVLSEYDGSFDALTRLYNRAAFAKAAKKLDGKKLYSVVVLDIDNFKEINDAYGHDYGDSVLKSIASVISESFNDSCRSYRVGGDEFYIIRRSANQMELDQLIKTMIYRLAQERENDRRLPTVSYGYSICKGEAKIGFQQVLKEADMQMYRFKEVHKDLPKKSPQAKSARVL